MILEKRVQRERNLIELHVKIGRENKRARAKRDGVAANKIGEENCELIIPKRTASEYIVSIDSKRERKDGIHKRCKTEMNKQKVGKTLSKNPLFILIIHSTESRTGGGTGGLLEALIDSHSCKHKQSKLSLLFEKERDLGPNK